MFEAPRLKVKRANKHIFDLKDSINAFIKTDFYSFGIESEVDTGDSVLQFKMVASPPTDLPLILGDAIHNLRASLDLAYVELAILAGKEPTQWTSLRVWENRDKLVNSLENGIFKGDSDIIDMLADIVRAYKGGNAFLEALDSIDQDDKHVLLTPVFTIARLDNVDAEIIMGGGGNITMRDCSFGVGQGGVLNAIGMPSGENKIKFHNKGQPTLRVVFGDGTCLKGEAIIPALTKFAQLVNQIIGIFETTISGRQKTAD